MSSANLQLINENEIVTGKNNNPITVEYFTLPNNKIEFDGNEWGSQQQQINCFSKTSCGNVCRKGICQFYLKGISNSINCPSGGCNEIDRLNRRIGKKNLKSFFTGTFFCKDLVKWYNTNVLSDRLENTPNANVEVTLSDESLNKVYYQCRKSGIESCCKGEPGIKEFCGDYFVQDKENESGACDNFFNEYCGNSLILGRGAKDPRCGCLISRLFEVQDKLGVPPWCLSIGCCGKDNMDCNSKANFYLKSNMKGVCLSTIVTCDIYVKIDPSYLDEFQRGAELINDCGFISDDDNKSKDLISNDTLIISLTIVGAIVILIIILVSYFVVKNKKKNK